MKKKQIMSIAIVALMFVVLITSVAYSALQTVLTINGNAKISGAYWNIHFENLSNPSILGDAQISEISLSDTLFKLNVELTKPRDSLMYTFDVKNDGTIPAKIDSVVTPDIEALNSNELTYSFTYADGSPINSGDLLDVGQSKKLKLSVKYNDVSSLNENSISLNLDSAILYVQA